MYCRLYGMSLDMLGGTFYAINNEYNDFDNGSYWIETMKNINNSKAFELIESNNNPTYFLY